MICTKGMQAKIRLGRVGESLATVQEIEIWSYEQMVYAQTRIPPGECDTRKQKTKKKQKQGP